MELKAGSRQISAFRLDTVRDRHETDLDNRWRRSSKFGPRIRVVLPPFGAGPSFCKPDRSQTSVEVGLTSGTNPVELSSHHSYTYFQAHGTHTSGRAVGTESRFSPLQR